MDLPLLIRARWHWLISISGGKLLHICAHIIFRTSRLYYDNLILNIVPLIPMLNLNLRLLAGQYFDIDRGAIKRIDMASTLNVKKSCVVVPESNH
jgi:hypothetical protein